jgi:hypothetical protein
MFAWWGRLPHPSRQAQNMLAVLLIAVCLALELQIGFTAQHEQTRALVIVVVGLQMIWPLHHFFPELANTCLRRRHTVIDDDENQV